MRMYNICTDTHIAGDSNIAYLSTLFISCYWCALSCNYTIQMIVNDMNKVCNDLVLILNIGNGSCSLDDGSGSRVVSAVSVSTSYSSVTRAGAIARRRAGAIARRRTTTERKIRMRKRERHRLLTKQALDAGPRMRREDDVYVYTQGFSVLRMNSLMVQNIVET